MQLILNGIVLNFEGKIKMKLNSPLFSELRSFSYEFVLKSTPTNDRAFGFARMPDSIVNSIKYDDFAIISDHFEFSGTLTIRSTSQDNYKVYFIAESLQGSIKNYQLKDLTDVIEFSMDRVTAGRNNDFLYVFPEIYFSQANEAASQFNYEKYYDYSSAYAVSYSSPRVPCFYIKKLLNKIFDLYGINYNYLLDDISEDFNDLLLFCNTPVDSFYLAESNFNENFVSCNLTSYASDFWLDEDNNKYKDFIITIQSETATEFPEEFTAKFIHLKESASNKWAYHNKFLTLEKVRDYEPTLAFYKFKYADVPILSNYFLADPADPDFIVKGTKTVVGTFTGRKAGEFLPNITVGELIKGVEDLLCIKFIFNDITRSVEIVKLKDIINDNSCESVFASSFKDLTTKENKGYYLGFSSVSDNYFSENNKQFEKRHNLKTPVDTKSDLPSNALVNDISLVEDTQQYFDFIENEWKVKQQSGVKGAWHFFSNHIFMPKNENAGYKVEAKAVPLSRTEEKKWKTLDANNKWIDYNYFNCAYGGDINFLDLLQENNFSDIRVLFFRGYVTDPNINSTYHWLPNTVVTDKNSLGEKIGYANLSLDFTEYENSILFRCAKEWAEFQSTRKDQEAFINWNVGFLADQKWKLKREIRGNLYMLVSTDIELSSDGDTKFDETVLAKC